MIVKTIPKKKKSLTIGLNRHTSCGFALPIKYTYADDRKIKSFIVVTSKEFYSVLQENPEKNNEF